MLEDTPEGGRFCNICAHEWSDQRSDVAGRRNRRIRTAPDREPASREPDGRFASIEDLIARTGVRRDELATLAEIGALNAFGHDRRSALWQIERAVRPAGELFRGQDVDDSMPTHGGAGRSPLPPMTPPSG